jgi:hypothetical protein
MAVLEGGPHKLSLVLSAWVHAAHRLASLLHITQVGQDCGIAVATIAGAMRVEVVILSQHVMRDGQMHRVERD